MAKVRDLPGNRRAKNETGRFNTSARKNDIASISSGSLAHHINPKAAMKPIITSQKRTNVPVLTLSLTSFSLLIDI